MSKLRQTPHPAATDLDVAPEPDLTPYVVFTRLTEGGPFLYAGWLDACDDDMAIRFAREHYGQDQACVAIRAVARRDLHGTDLDEAPSEDGPGGIFHVFTQQARGDLYRESDPVEADNAAAALEAARRAEGDDAHGIWVARADRAIDTEPDDLIWRYTDQTYRFARGYSKAVRTKWEHVRAERDIREYEREDLEEAF